MKRVVQNPFKASGATGPQIMQNSTHVVRTLILVFLTAATMYGAAPVGATSVVTLIDNVNRRIVMAADCRVNRANSSISQCKIIEAPGCTVAIAGVYREDTTAFDLRRLVEAACRYPGDLFQKAEAFLRFSKKPYETAVRHIRKTDPNDFSQTIENKPTEVIFAGLLRGHLTLLVRGFVSDPNGRITAERYASSDASNSSIGYIAGLNRHIREQLKPHSQWESLGYTEVARRFVQLEIDANPDLAGPPISELEIDNWGTVHWISPAIAAGRRSSKSFSIRTTRLAPRSRRAVPVS
jgi:hypothetical protein